MIELTPDICVIGAGAAGLSVAAGTAQLGAETVLIEAGEMGGDCLNFGCVPSKSLLAAAKAAVAHRHLAGFGVNAAPPQLDRQTLQHHIKDVIAGIAPHDSVERFEGLGVKVIRQWARFIDQDTVEVGGYRIRARRFVLATGSTPMIPPIPGLDRTPHFTNETIFDHVAEIRDLAILGGGPIGVELAQGFARLGAKVTIYEMQRLLPRDDEEAAQAVRDSLVKDGVAIFEGATVIEVGKTEQGARVSYKKKDGTTGSADAAHLLVATGRRPRVENMGLENAGIRYSSKGIEVDAGLRTSNRRVLAIGDCTGGPAFTHVGGYHAGIVIRRALFRLPAKVDYRALPWVTYSDPELAQLGLTETEARAKSGARGGAVEIVRLNYLDNDRARTERKTDGFIKVMADARGRILGVTILGEGAGDLLAPWCLAMGRNLKLSALAGTLLPYPTLSELSKRAAGQFYAPRLFSERMRAVVRFLRLFG